MIWVKVLYAVGLPTASGYLLATLIIGNRCAPMERLFAGFGLGFGLLAIEAFLLGLAGFPLTAASLSVSQFVVASVLLSAVFYRRENMYAGVKEVWLIFKKDKLLLKLSVAVLAVWLSAKISFVMFEGFMRPMVSHDIWLNWSAGAKLFYYYNKSLSLQEGSEFFFGKGYRLFIGHPLLTVLSQVWLSTVVGQWHEALAKAWQPFYYIALLGVFFYAIKAAGGAWWAFLSTFMLATMPLFTYHAIEGYADLPLAFYSLTGTVFLWRHMEAPDSMRYPLMAGLLYSMGVFTKNEGAMYLVIAVGVLVAFNIIEKRYRFAGVACFIAAAVAYILPWIIFKMHYGIGFGHSYAHAGVNWDTAFHTEVFALYFKGLFLSASNGLVFLFLVILTAVGLRIVLKSNIKYLHLMVILAMAAFLGVYAGTRDYAAVTQGTGMHRNILTFMPIAFFAAVLLAAKLWDAAAGDGAGSCAKRD